MYNLSVLKIHAPLQEPVSVQWLYTMSVWGDPAFKFLGTKGRQCKYPFCFCLSGTDTWNDWYPFKVLFMLCHAHTHTQLPSRPLFIFPVYSSWFLSWGKSFFFLLETLLFMSWFVATFSSWLHWSSPAIRFYPTTWIKNKKLLHCNCATFIFVYHLLYLHSVIYQEW